MGPRDGDRRRLETTVRYRPRPSPANILVITVIGVLGAMAAAAALFGTGLEETTPHGQVLTTLQRVAEAQERHHQETGTFARWMQSLDVETSGEVRVDLVRADDSGWEAMAGHSVGLTCIQGGKVNRGTMQREQPLCYTVSD